MNEEINISSIHMLFTVGTYTADINTTRGPAELVKINTVTSVISATYKSQCKPITATVYINHAWEKLYLAPQCKMFSLTESK
jgi:hypothetical protein